MNTERIHPDLAAERSNIELLQLVFHLDSDTKLIGEQCIHIEFPAWLRDSDSGCILTMVGSLEAFASCATALEETKQATDHSR